MSIPKFSNHHNCSSPGYTSDLRAAAYETLFAYETLLLRNTIAYETLLLRNTFAFETIQLMKHCMTLSSRNYLFKSSSTSEKCSAECLLPSVINVI